MHGELTLGALVQISTDQFGTAPNGSSSEAATSSNGRVVVFTTQASDLVAADTNGAGDIFLIDRKTGERVLVSLNNTLGVVGNEDSGNPSVSPTLPDGFYAIAFESASTNLSSVITTNDQTNIFIRLPTLQLTEIASAGPGFTSPNQSALQPDITVVRTSDNKNKILVVYSSDSTNLIDSDTNGQFDIFLSEGIPPASPSAPGETIRTTRISNAFSDAEQPDGASFTPQISDDGKFVVFASRASNLVFPPLPSPNYNSQIYVYNVATKTTEIISRDINGNLGTGDSLFPRISYNGRYIAYSTYAANLVDGVASFYGLNVLRYDTVTKTTVRLNISAQGVAGDGIGTIDMSANGRLIAFADTASLVDNDNNSLPDIFVKDLDTGSLRLISNGVADTASNGTSVNPRFAFETLTKLTGGVVFESTATNLTQPSLSDGSNNIFVREISFPVPEVSVDTRIEVPPDVKIRSKALIFSAQKFALESSEARLVEDGTNIQPLAAAATSSLRYQWDIRRSTTIGQRRRNVRYITRTKSTNLALNKLRKATYRVRNRVLVVDQQGQTRIRTPFSPMQSLSTN